MYPAPFYYPPPIQGQEQNEGQGQNYNQGQGQLGAPPIQVPLQMPEENYQNPYTPAYPQAPPPPSPATSTYSPGGKRKTPDLYPYKTPPLDNPLNKAYYTSGNVPADPTCSIFPGLVPNSDRLDYSGFDTITLNLSTIIGSTEIPSRWLSTGFYAVPGLQIGMKVTTNIQDENQREHFFRYSLLLIGCHTDDNRNNPDEVDQNNLLRPPVISIRTEIDPTVGSATLANPYGGLIYLIVPTVWVNSYQVTLALSGGRVRAPNFNLEETKLNDWIHRIRHEPGQFGELQSDKIIFCLPRSEIKNVKNPSPILRFWDGVLDAMHDLLGMARERARPERMVMDIQISTEWLHTGYPIMCPLCKIPDILDWRRIKHEGDWGLFHEMGHLHENDVWVFDGADEVCVNLFAMYIYDVHLKIPISKSGHKESFLPETIKEQIGDYIKSNKNFKKVWKEEPFLALLMYYQLILRYSWQAFTAVFTAYRNLTPEMLPNDEDDNDKRENQEKVHLWIYMFSQTVKENLYDFFKSWNLPIKDMRCGEFILKINPNFPLCPMRMEDLLKDPGPASGIGTNLFLPLTSKSAYSYENNAKFVGPRRKCCVIL